MKIILKNNKKNVIFVSFLLIISSSIDIYSGYLLSELFNITQSDTLRQAVSIAIYVLVIRLISVLLASLSSIVEAKVIQGINNDIRKTIIGKISKMDYISFSKKDPGEYVSWFINDIEQIEKNILLPFFQ